MDIKPRIFLNSGDTIEKEEWFSFLAKNAERRIPIQYTISSHFDSELLRSDLSFLEHQNLRVIRLTPSQSYHIEPIVENIRAFPNTLYHLEITLSPYQITIDMADLLFKHLLFLPKSIRSISISINFYDQQDSLSRFLIIHLPKLNPQLTTLKLSLNGCSNLLELSKKLNQLPQKLRSFKLRAYDIDLPPASVEFFTANLERLPKTIDHLTLCFESLICLDAFTKAVPNLPSKLVSLALKAKSANFTDEEFSHFIKALGENLLHLKSLKLSIPENKQSQEVFQTLEAHIWYRLERISLNVQGYNIWNVLQNNSLHINHFIDLNLNLAGCFNSNEDIISFFELVFQTKQLKHFSLTLGDDDITAQPLQFLLNNVSKLKGQISKFHLRFINPSFRSKDIKVPDDLLASIPDNIKEFVVRAPCEIVSVELLQTVIRMYKQIDKLHYGIERFAIEFNHNRVNFEIKEKKQITFYSSMQNFFLENHAPSYNKFIQRILFDTPPRFQLYAVSITPQIQLK